MRIVCGWRVLGAVLSAALFMSAATASAADILRRGNHDEPETLDPHLSDGSEEFWVQSDMFVGLTKIDAHGKVAPDLASSWEIAPDGLSWTFHLRPNLKWSDGKSLTADDLVWSLRRAVDPRTAALYASILSPIAGADQITTGAEKDLTKLGVSAPDPGTLVIRLRIPTAYLDGLMSLGIAFPLPRQAIEQYRDGWTRPGHIVCSGAFTLASWVPQERIRMVRNPNYYAASSVRLDGVDWVVMPDDRTALRAFRSGELDIARLPTEEVPWAQKEMPAELHTGVNLWTTYIIVNTQRKPLDDVRLRQALSMSIDREIIVKRVVPRGQQVATALVPPGIEGYTPAVPVWFAKPMADRVAEAKQLVAAAGYGPEHPLQVDMIYTSNETTKRELGAVREMWAAIGVKAVLLPEENQVVESATRHRDYQLSAYGWIADYADPWTFLSIFRTDAGGGLNNPDYRNPAYDSMLTKANEELDPAKRMALLHDAETMIAHDQPVIPLEYNVSPRVVGQQVGGYFDNPLDIHHSADMSIDPAKRPAG